jgi:lysophospholipase L1-like esterase
MRGESASRAALVAASVVVALAIAEGVARLLTDEPQLVFRNSITPSDDPLLGYALRPGARDADATISSAGLRDREFVSPKPAGTWRLAAIGDSITYGSGGPASASYPKQLERLLTRARTESAPRIEVLNLGVPGYNLPQIVQRLRTLAPAFQPDAIVYGYSLNDPQSFSIEAEALRRLRNGVEERVAATTFEAWLARSRIVRLVRQEAAARASLAALRADMPNDPTYAAAKSGDPAQYLRAIHTEGESAARVAQGIAELATVARNASQPVLVAIFPLFGDVGTDPLDDVRARVGALAAEHGLAALDLAPAYAAAARALGARLRADILHPDALGHHVAAVALFTWMCRHAWPPGGGLDCDAPWPEPIDATIASAIAGAVP